jgi:hypothetical protein
MKFSERYGYEQVRTSLQIESVDDGLRNRLWNVICIMFFHDVPKYSSANSNYLPNNNRVSRLLENLYHSYFKERTDKIPLYYMEAVKQLRDYYTTCTWHGVYDFLEFLAGYLRSNQTAQSNFVSSINEILKEEVAGYRFVGDQIVQITDEVEIVAIERALQVPDSLKSVKDHLQQALSHLADRKSPDYRNSIKESISAVEALCGIITKQPNGTLGQTLKLVDMAADLHPALKEGFNKLYGYTSDADGIRHAMMEESNLDQEDAKFMLVSCSAFVNYLIVKANKAGIAL